MFAETEEVKPQILNLKQSKCAILSVHLNVYSTKKQQISSNN